jgi:hypothetical protein
MSEKTNKGPMIMKFSQQVPDPTLPVIHHVRGQSWQWYGIDNLYPNNLITPLYNGSAMNRTCITSKHVYTVGEGLKTKNPELQYVLNRANSFKESWTDVFSRFALDWIIFGGAALNIIWSEDGEQITDIYNMDFNDIRSGHIDKETDRVEWYYYSADWTKYKKDIYRPKAVKAFDPAKADLYPNQILYAFNYNPGSKIYPIPDYSGALTAAQVDVSVDSFHYWNLMNGLNPSLFVQMNNGIPSPEERQDIYEELASSFSGVDGAGKFFLSFANDKEHATEVTPIESANDDYYISLSQRISQQILTAHKITSPLLLGIKDMGGSGLTNNKDEITTAALHFQNTTIKPIQTQLLKIWDKLFHLYGYEGEGLYIEPLALFNSDGEEVVQETVTAKV